MATGDGIMVIPSDVAVTETILAAQHSVKGKDSLANFISPIVNSPKEIGRTFKFNDQFDKAGIDDLVGPLNSSPIVEVGIESGTFACVPHRRAIVLAAENLLQNDSGLLVGLVKPAEILVNALEKRRAYNILASCDTAANYTYKYDINTVSKKWGVAGSNPQDDVEKYAEALALRLGLDETEMQNIRIFAGSDVHRVMKTKVLSAIKALGGDSSAVDNSAMQSHFGLGQYRASFGSYNAAAKGSATSSRAYMSTANNVLLFYCPDNPSTETPLFKVTIRFQGKDLTGKPATGGWMSVKDDPPVVTMIHRDYRTDATFDWNAATLLTSVV